MASYLNNYLRGIGAGGFMKDYRHASNIYGAGNYRLSPKFKFLYHCVFILDRTVASQNYKDNELGVIVKAVDLPSAQFDVENQKAYNRHAYNYTGIQYSPVSIEFHDDNANNVRNFLADIYTYYSSDGTHQDGEYNVRTLGVRDTALEESTSASLKWGINSTFSETGKNILKEIQIYTLSKGVGARYSLKNPIVTRYSHGSHNQSDTSPNSSTIEVIYDGYTYADVNVAAIPNFASGAYDKISGSTSSGLASIQNGVVQTLRNALDSVPDTSPYDILNTAAATLSQTTAFENVNRILNTGQSVATTLQQVTKNANAVFPTATVRKAEEIIKGIKF